MCGYDPFWIFELREEQRYLEEYEEYQKEQQQKDEKDED